MPYVQAGEVRLHYIEYGSGPEPLVFIHGFTSSTNAWSETLPQLPERYHAYALDLRGAGESDKPEGGYGPQIYAEEIHLAKRALGLDTFTYIGHSMGGVTGMAFACAIPSGCASWCSSPRRPPAASRSIRRSRRRCGRCARIVRCGVAGRKP
ncbi:MAG: alpha/beta fold hydrolase [Dehalococcoidia bacterium]